MHRIVVGTGAPLRDGTRIRSLFAERLAAIGDACDPGFGFDVIRLCAFASERSDPVQTGFAAPEYGVELAHLVDRIGARFGLRRITRLVPQDTHIPEFAVMAVAGACGIASLCKARSDRESRLFQDSLGSIRPIRLFEQPERIEATGGSAGRAAEAIHLAARACMLSSMPKAPSASPWNGGATIKAAR